MLRDALRSAHRSAPGPGASPHAAWAASPFATGVLWGALEWPCSGQSLFDDAGDAIHIFSPGNVADLEQAPGDCARAPDK
eukprot:7224797-Pyramimonas_sp.AAC.1